MWLQNCRSMLFSSRLPYRDILLSLHGLSTSTCSRPTAHAAAEKACRAGWRPVMRSCAETTAKPGMLMVL